jgi:calreticulin
MSKLSKAIKLTQGLTDEEKVEFADFFKVEEEEKKEETKQEEKKEEQKDESKEEETNIEKLFKEMKGEITTLKEKVEKMKPFGAKQKQQTSKDANEFDDLFATYRSQQRS